MSEKTIGEIEKTFSSETLISFIKTAKRYQKCGDDAETIERRCSRTYNENAVKLIMHYYYND